jgi:hypothetical protein
MPGSVAPLGGTDFPQDSSEFGQQGKLRKASDTRRWIV